MKNFLQELKIDRVANSASAAQTAIDGSVVDMAGYDGVIFLALLGDVTSGCVLTLTGKKNTANSTSSPTPTNILKADGNAAAATFTAGASDADNKVLAVDCVNPGERYVYPNLTRTTANAVVDGIIAIRYKAHNKPVVNSDLLASVSAYK